MLCCTLPVLPWIHTLFFFNDTATTEIYTLSLTTLFRSLDAPGEPAQGEFDLEVEVPHLHFEVELALGRRSEEHTSELQSRLHLVCRLLLEKKKNTHTKHRRHPNQDARAGPSGGRASHPA